MWRSSLSDFGGNRNYCNSVTKNSPFIYTVPYIQNTGAGFLLERCRFRHSHAQITSRKKGEAVWQCAFARLLAAARSSRRDNRFVGLGEVRMTRGRDHEPVYGLETGAATPVSGRPHTGDEQTGGDEFRAYKEALSNAAIVAKTDLRGRIVDVNRQFCLISEYDPEELIGRPHSVVNSGFHSREFFRNLWAVISAGAIWRGDICNRAKSGRHYWVDTTIVPLREPEGRMSGYLSIRFDVTDRKLAEAELVKELGRREVAEDLLRDIVEAVPSGIVTFGPDGNFQFSNRAFHEFYGSAPKGKGHAPHRGLLSVPIERLPELDDMWPSLRKEDSRRVTKPYIRQLGADQWVQISNRRSTSGNFVSVQTDISGLKRAELQIKYQAEKDALTGLSNRSALLRRLKRYAQSRSGKDRKFALMLVDLDDFKAVNDRHGHDGGDTLLQIVAQRIRSSVRKTDMVARLGGDEFAILLRDVEHQRDVSEVAKGLLESLGQPARLGRRTVVPSGSIGASLFPRDGESPKELLKNADLALYQAKSAGRNRCTVYSSSMRRERQRRERLVEKLREAISSDGLTVALQPQNDVRFGRHHGFEALVRWKSGRRDIPPPELISVAEEAGLICEVGYQVIDKGLAALACLKRDNLQPGTIAFNVSSAQLLQPEFAGRLLELMHRHGVEGVDVEIEVTENVILDRSADGIALSLRELHAAGISVALDDFGTGYASLIHLKRFPIDRLKIDRSFITGMLDGKNDGIIVRTIISLAHSLGFTVVAEGVETPAQYRELSNLGCDFVQGYLLAQPMNEASAREYLAEQQGSWPSLHRDHGSPELPI
ncbi:putative bifunctional diguanylate cyclase/phosphodiesterase [Novosphingobium album (ex Hu et al. 2023)]|uniref:putative bifunctional diguanylate cyclase/phosphodiesterase n=1 Tax=Novosphingobium album (ex Hu et al. 2023) TaxID=2930093 RepID=UPI001FBA0AE6|nr:bifunctional diguanylate cyclase/phosphodiesterase [Novosphingobium album (ex Hu et al. 2023)]